MIVVKLDKGCFVKDSRILGKVFLKRRYRSRDLKEVVRVGKFLVIGFR